MTRKGGVVVSLCSRGFACVGVALTLTVALVCGVSVAGATGVCSNEGFRVGPSSELPDCRAYEMVSPPDKNGGQVSGGINFGVFLLPPEQAAANGEAVTYGSTSSFVETDPASAEPVSQYLSRRTAGGWRTSEIIPVQELPEGKFEANFAGAEFSLYQGFNEDLEDGFLLAWNPQPDSSAPSGYYNPYLFEAGSGRYQLLSGVTPPSHQPGRTSLALGKTFAVVYAGMSADGKHVIFEANDALTPNAIPGQVNFYEWSAGRPLELVSVLPEGTVDPSGTVAPISLAGTPSMSFGVPQEQEYAGGPSAGGVLSSDGLRAFWNGGESTGDQLYMHEIVGPGARTVDVSASQRSGQSQSAAQYWAANSSGSRVYFTSTYQLTEDSTAAGGGNDLYCYEVESGKLIDLTVDANAGETAAVQGVLGTGESEGVSYLYFVAHGVLASGATAGANNLYVSRGGGAPVFVASLGAYAGSSALTVPGGEVSDFTAKVHSRTSRVSPDGRFLAFQSAVPLTGYDNVPANGQPCPEPQGTELGRLYATPPEGRCMEVYEYDALAGPTGRLTCVSCQADGLPPTTDAMVPETHEMINNLSGWQSSTVQQRYLLDDGRLYFQTEDALLAQATNGKMNVFEYEPDGVGQCSAAGTGGCVYLISTGQSSGESYFADASTNGRDVFFLTSQSLVPQDGDEAIDMYDAREGGGFAVVSAPPCSGEACKPPLQPAPAIYGPPASATFQGAGNIAPASTNVKTVSRASAKSSRKTRKVKHRKKARKAGRTVRAAHRREFGSARGVGR